MFVAPSPLVQLPVNRESEATGAFRPAPVAALPAQTCQGSTLITRPEPCAAALVHEPVNRDGEDTGTLAVTAPVAALPPHTCQGAMLITVRSLSLDALTQLPVNVAGDAAATFATAGPVAALPAHGCHGSTLTSGGGAADAGKDSSPNPAALTAPRASFFHINVFPHRAGRGRAPVSGQVPGLVGVVGVSDRGRSNC
jgi:hypothetical protein